MAKLHYREAVSEKEKKAFAPFLSEDEELILATGLGVNFLRSAFVMAIFWPGILFAALFLLIYYFFISTPEAFSLNLALGIGFLGAIVGAILRTSHIHNANRYLLTTRRVIVKKGVFAVRLSTALYDKITHIEMDQSFFDRLLMHHGHIVINTAGTNKDEIILKNVDYPIELKNLLERLINREREQFAIHSTPLVRVEGEVIS